MNRRPRAPQRRRKQRPRQKRQSTAEKHRIADPVKNRFGGRIKRRRERPIGNRQRKCRAQEVHRPPSLPPRDFDEPPLSRDSIFASIRFRSSGESAASSTSRSTSSPA